MRIFCLQPSPNVREKLFFQEQNFPPAPPLASAYRYALSREQMRGVTFEVLIQISTNLHVSIGRGRCHRPEERTPGTKEYLLRSNHQPPQCILASKPACNDFRGKREGDENRKCAAVVGLQIDTVPIAFMRPKLEVSLSRNQREIFVQYLACESLQHA